MRTERITVTRSYDGKEWRWSWTAKNGRIIAASSEGYVRRKRAIENLERISGGKVELVHPGPHPFESEYAQGLLSRRTHAGAPQIVFVEVLP